jgi:oxygen-dependent protoporphyrinogen oxidase
MSADPATMRRPRVVVIGAGISGLATAWHIARRRHDIDIHVVDGADQIGGLLRVSELEGLALDEGAESMLATRPEAVRLARDVGLGDSIVHPTAARPSVVVNGELKPFPAGLMMGIPTNLRDLGASGVLSPQALARIPMDYVLPRTAIGQDVSFGDYVSNRLGSDVVDRLVAPLIMGVYADDPHDVSMMSAMPALLEAARTDASLLSATRRVRKTPTGPVFAGIEGGVGRLASATANRLMAAGVNIQTNAMVGRLRRTAHGWQVDFVDSDRWGSLEADAVIVAVPAKTTRYFGKFVLASAPKLVIAALPVMLAFASRRTTLLAPLDVATPVPPFATGNIPVTPVLNGRPVALVSVALCGVPRIGVTSVGLVANTNAPDPVSSEITPASSLDDVAANALNLFEVRATVPVVAGSVMTVPVPAIAVGIICAVPEVEPGSVTLEIPVRARFAEARLRVTAVVPT